MYKILVETPTISNLKQTPYRKVVDPTSQLKQSQKQLEVASVFEAPEIRGRIHLYKDYRSEQEEDQTKLNLLANKIQIKTQALFINRIRKDDFKPFLERLKESADQIDVIDFISEPGDQVHLSLTILFKSLLASEEIYQLSLLHFQALPLYLHETIIALLPQGNERSRECLAFVNPEACPQAETFVEHQRWVELPRCLKCLQRLEYDLTGIAPSIFQQLSKPQPALPCQTCLTLSGLHSATCALCGTPEDNWICMVCSKVGCGRYKNGDAFRHFLCEGHIITMDLETQRVWNYLADCFSHRVIPLQKQEITLKFPEVSQKHQRYEESLEGAFWEYCSVVSEELDRQRTFYQRQRNEEQELFKKEALRMDELIASTKSELERREEALKKTAKRHKKSDKRLDEVRESCKMQREILSNYEQTIREQVKQQSLAQVQLGSDRIQQKLKILQSIDLQIESILAKLTQ